MDEIEQILSSRCRIAPSFARRIAQVYRILQERRSAAGTNIFAGKHALITLRDCFRWAERHSHSAVGSTQELAQDGYFVLAERCRHPEEAEFIRSTPSKRSVKLNSNPSSKCTISRAFVNNVDGLKIWLVWSWSSNWLVICASLGLNRFVVFFYPRFTLCIRLGEPVILVGETGCGKTTVCQLVAQILQRALRIVNCHANSESGDFLGSFRPVRTDSTELAEDSPSKLFQWTDGPLVEAMKQGDLFLMDEISLADDSVLERLNSVLEPSRYLLLAECTENDEARVISSSPNFAILATMNPGGDFGKKELSPALRNRFTEIWVPNNWRSRRLATNCKIKFTQFTQSIHGLCSHSSYYRFLVLVAGGFDFFKFRCFNSFSFETDSFVLRDLLGWLQFVNSPAVIATVPRIELRLLHGAAMIFTDRLGNENVALRLKTLNHLADALNLTEDDRLQVIEIESSSKIVCDSGKFSIGPFTLEIDVSVSPCSEPFAFEAPTTRISALRVLRALQLGKAVLLEEARVSVNYPHFCSRLRHRSQTYTYQFIGTNGFG